jgi:hypothetical protein
MIQNYAEQPEPKVKASSSSMIIFAVFLNLLLALLAAVQFIFWPRLGGSGIVGLIISGVILSVGLFLRPRPHAWGGTKPFRKAVSYD